MTSMVIDGIGVLYTGDPERAEIEDAAAGRRGRSGGLGRDRRPQAPQADRRVDAGGRAVIPGFVDSHAHLVFAGDRTAEFEARMTGQPYTGGGIRTTVAATRAGGRRRAGDARRRPGRRDAARRAPPPWRSRAATA